jgi:hypothetical protein
MNEVYVCFVSGDELLFPTLIFPCVFVRIWIPGLECILETDDYLFFLFFYTPFRKTFTCYENSR